jgi:DNA transformation protein
MATPDAEFAAHCVELLQPLGAARAKRMFGGHGLYLEGLMVGLISDEQLYLKTDAQTVAQWQEAGGQPFVYRTRRQGEVKTSTMSYWTPPAEAVESPALMRPWARLALEAALRAQAARPPRPSADSRLRKTATSRRANTARPRKP